MRKACDHCEEPDAPLCEDDNGALCEPCHVAANTECLYCNEVPEYCGCQRCEEHAETYTATGCCRACAAEARADALYKEYREEGRT